VTLHVTRTDFVAMPVDDLGRASEFYGETLGLDRNPLSSGEEWVEFETGNLTLALSTFGGGVAIGVPDVDEARHALEEAGVEFRGETFDTGVCHGAGFHDPDGNRLQLHHRYAPLERYEPVADDVQRTDFIGVMTQDAERAERFYEQVLGLRRDPNHTEGWADFDTGKVSLVITDVAKTGQQFRPNGGAVALRVPDVAASTERLRAKGVEFDFDDVYDSGVCHMAFFNDPDGNALMLHHRYAPYRDGTTP
jgi:catechol 2,3-dioxygenase-like lactoylglutathione lyase family enzyme